jgi:hypothetical protein
VDGQPTSWTFKNFMPQLDDFMSNVAAHGHPVIWNFGTIPTWMFHLVNNSYSPIRLPAFVKWGESDSGNPFDSSS